MAEDDLHGAQGRRQGHGGHDARAHRKQGKYHYVYGPYAEPVLRIAPGDVVVAETQDAFENRITSESDNPTEILHMPFVNPQCGPIAVTGAEKGDVLCVYIQSIKPRGPQPVGTTALIPEFGGLVGTGNTAMLNAPLAERVKKMEVTEQGIKFNAKITLPYEPFIGTLGVCSGDRGDLLAAAGLLWRQHGRSRRGAGRDRVLPGAAQGRLSVSRRLPRHPGRRRTVRRRGRNSDDDDHPGRSDQGLDDLMAAHRNENFHHDDRLRPPDGGRRAHRLSRADLLAGRGLRLRHHEAYFLMTQAGRMRVGNMVDPKYSLGASILKSYL